jgi:hypothetical protein
MWELAGQLSGSLGKGDHWRNPFNPELTFWKSNGHSQKQIPSKTFPHEFEFV